jgi:hypothetical protein
MSKRYQILPNCSSLVLRRTMMTQIPARRRRKNMCDYRVYTLLQLSHMTTIHIYFHMLSTLKRVITIHLHHVLATLGWKLYPAEE